MNATHTPGPWKVNSSWSNDLGVVADDRLVAMVTNDEDRPIDDAEQLANARIMAAAPELLAALKLAVRVMQDNGIDESMAGEFDVFTDAIAKAEGRA